MKNQESAANPTIFVYTQEKRGTQWVESPIIGAMADFSSSEKYVVVMDPYSKLKFVYQIEHRILNLDAIAVVDIDPVKFDGKTTVQFNAMTYKLSPPAMGAALLKGNQRWIQDKGAVLAILLDQVSTNTLNFNRRRLTRQRITEIPADAPVEHLKADMPESATPESTTPEST